MKIPFLRRFHAKEENNYIQNVLNSKLEGDGFFTNKVKKQIAELTDAKYIIPMTSCTHALELAVRLSGISYGDEVIIPSFTFPSTANAVLLSGGIPVYAKVNPVTMNIDPNSIEASITKRTKGIIPVHYGGASCEMDKIIEIAKKYELIVIEDAAQGIDSNYNGQHLGTIGDFGCISFHGTKNLVAGEGGVLLLKDNEMLSKADIFKDKGTNRKQFVENKISRYQWVDVGSSYSPSELNMAILSAQLEEHDYVKNKRMEIYDKYQSAFSSIEKDVILTPKYGDIVDHNGHIFFLKFYNALEAKDYYSYMQEKSIDVRTHFEPLHKSVMGHKYLRPNSNLKLEDDLGTTVVRLPIYPDLLDEEQDYIIESTLEWLK